MKELPRPLPDPVEATGDTDPSFTSDLYEVDENLQAVRVSEDYDGPQSEEIAGKEFPFDQIGAQLEEERWYVFVITREIEEDMSMTEMDDCFVPLDMSEVEAWIYTTEEREKLKELLEKLKEARELANQPDWFFANDIENAIDKAQNHLESTQKEVVETNGT